MRQNFTQNFGNRAFLVLVAPSYLVERNKSLLQRLAARHTPPTR